jgi:hypothetical protein
MPNKSACDAARYTPTFGSLRAARQQVEAIGEGDDVLPPASTLVL